MGCPKALLDFGGSPLILHSAALLKTLVASVTIVGPPSQYAALGLPVTADDVPAHAGSDATEQQSRGPLAGIATALGATHAPWNLIVACDLPYLSSAWLEWLLARALRSQGEAVIPRSEYGMEPLAAVYRRECAAPIAAALAQGVRKVSDAIARLPVEFVDRAEWSEIDPSECILKNMNSPKDYEEARKWWQRGRERESSLQSAQETTAVTGVESAIRSSPE
jgi:molybdopterin-guanine dinucleotide biosynthesis protein A